MSDTYPKGSGALFTNTDKQKENHPDFRGNIEVSAEQIRKLIEMSKAGLEVKLQVAGWWRQAKSSGTTYMSMVTEAYMKDQEPQQYPPMQQQGGYQQPQAGQIPQPPQSMAPQPQQGYQPQQQPQQIVPQQAAPVQIPPQTVAATTDSFEDDIPF